MKSSFGGWWVGRRSGRVVSPQAGDFCRALAGQPARLTAQTRGGYPAHGVQRLWRSQLDGEAMGKRNEALQQVADVLVGDWKLTMTNAWFWENPADVVEGAATVAWLDDAFLIMRMSFG